MAHSWQQLGVVALPLLCLVAFEAVVAALPAAQGVSAGQAHRGEMRAPEDVGETNVAGSTVNRYGVFTPVYLR